MATVIADMSMSLDGFVAGPGDRIDEVFSWMSGGEVAVETSNPDLGVEVDEASADELADWSNIKALVIGRRTFDLAGGWNGTHPVGVPVWIPTHNPPDGWDDSWELPARASSVRRSTHGQQQVVLGAAHLDAIGGLGANREPCGRPTAVDDAAEAR